MDNTGRLRCLWAVAAALQLFAAHSVWAQKETPQPEKTQLPKVEKPRITRDWYPPSAIKKRLEAITLTAFKIDPSGRIVEARTVGAPIQNELHKTAVEFLTRNLRFSMPAEPELSHVIQHEFRAVLTFSIFCEEQRKKNRLGGEEESDKAWMDIWIDITTEVQCQRPRGL